MTIEELKSLIEYLPDEMLVLLPYGKEYITACEENSKRLDIVFKNSDGETYTDGAFIISPCLDEEDTHGIAEESENNPN